MAEKKYHVVAKVDGGWKVVKAGAVRAVRTFDSKSAAVSYGQNISRNEHSELVIHGIDGRFERRTSFAADPIPPKPKH